jgi:hypothetical protein
MSNWLKGDGAARAYMAGVLVTLVFSAQEKAFLLKIASDQDDGLIQNVKVGQGVGNNPAPTITCFHQTIPRTNYTAFYRRLNSHDIILIGSGNHTSSNTKYFVQWADGTTGSLDLKQIGTGADLLAAPKTLGPTGAPR